MFTTIFFLGLAGSLHCVGMCGPLTLIAPVNRTHRMSMLGDMTLYHAARVAVYALMGAIIGTAGQLFAISKVQSSLALFFGVLLVLWGLSYYLPLGRQKFLDTFGVDRWFVKIYNRYLQHTNRKNVAILAPLTAFCPVDWCIPLWPWPSLVETLGQEPYKWFYLDWVPCPCFLPSNWDWPIDPYFLSSNKEDYRPYYLCCLVPLSFIRPSV